MLDLCGWEQNELTGDLATDIPGAWRQSDSGFHPLTTIASNPQVLPFEPDGTGHIWWTYAETTLLDGGQLAFEWSVENNQLVVDDLPPAEIEAIGPGELVVQGTDDEASRNTTWARCQEELLNSLPDSE